MKINLARHSSNQSVSDLIMRATVGLIFFGATAFATLALPTAQPDLLNGITFADSITHADRAYLQDSLKFLQDTLPEWYEYVVQTEPFVLSVGPMADADWIAAKSICCDERGNGSITFEDHFNRVVAPNDPSGETTQAKRVAFLSTLIHEVTHLRDYRAEQMPTKMDAVTCINSEASAYAKEFEFKRAVVGAQFSDTRSGELYRHAAEEELADDERQFNTYFWKLDCILTHQSIMDN